MTRHERDRFVARDFEGKTLGRFPNRRKALDRARQEARRTGREAEVLDSLAKVGNIELWSVPAAGTVRSLEVRTVETEKRDLQSGVGR